VTPSASACTGLRVAQVVATSAFAGTERYAANLAAGLTGLGAGVVLIGGHQPLVAGALVHAGTDVTHVPAGNLAEVFRQLRRLGHFDIVHAHLTAAEIAATAAFPTRSRTAVVSTRHIAAQRGSSHGARLAARWVRSRLDGQVAISEYVAAKVDGRSRVIPTGVPDQVAGPHTEHVVVVAQRLEPEKDTATALRAWAESRLAAEGWELHVAGAGAESHALASLAGELGVDKSCRFLGQVADTTERFGRAGILLATAVAEPFGLSVVEAMASGLPVVASAAGGHLETVAPLPGAIMFAPGDHVSAGEALRLLAQDAERRACYGRDLRARQQSEYSFANFLAKVVAWYTDVLSERGYRR